MRFNELNGPFWAAAIDTPTAEGRRQWWWWWLLVANTVAGIVCIEINIMMVIEFNF